MSDNVFQKIIRREIPASIVYEDDLVLAFRDANPQAPVHILIIPKIDIPRLAAARSQKLVGYLLLKAAAIAAQLGLDKSGYRLVINNGPDACESIPHLHVHLLAKRQMRWPPG